MATVLVIDDDADLREIARRALTMAGHTVLQAENGRVGLEAVERHAPDIVVTDLLMPVREGLQVIREVRRLSRRNVPILAVSGGGRTARLDLLDIAREIGADDTLAKPFRPREFVEAVERLLEVAGRAQQP